MKILAIDTSCANNLSLAISDDSQVLFEQNFSLIEDLSQEIIPAIKSLLKRSGKTLGSFDGFAVSLGPGSFTGLRIGLSAVKAFSLALNKPIVGVSSLDVLADSITHPNSQICSLIDAKRDNVYACFYDKKNNRLKKITPYLLMNIDCFIKKINKKTVFTGDALYLYKDNLLKKKKNLCSFAQEKLWFSRAGGIIKLSFERFKNRLTDTPETISPIYLYPKECQIRKG